MARRRRKKITSEEAIAMAVVITALCLAVIWFVSNFWPVLLITFLLVGLFFLVRYIIRRKRDNAVKSHIHEHLRKALKAMDSTGRWYTDENEANRELVTSLKMLGLDAEYQHRLRNRRVADARVGDMLIEGKLSPTTDEVDRLIGQLEEYCHHGNVNVVIYGQLNRSAEKRIENEILSRHRGRAFLTHLPDARRQRSVAGY